MTMHVKSAREAGKSSARTLYILAVMVLRCCKTTWAEAGSFLWVILGMWFPGGEERSLWRTYFPFQNVWSNGGGEQLPAMELRAPMSHGPSAERSCLEEESRRPGSSCVLTGPAPPVSAHGGHHQAPLKGNAYMFRRPCSVPCAHVPPLAHLVSADWTKGWHLIHRQPIHRLASHPCRWLKRSSQIGSWTWPAYMERTCRWEQN